MFYLRYLAEELRRRPGRTALTALGLAVGVGLVVIVGALSKGLDDAQAEVLGPLTGVGTDLAVSRPLAVPGGDKAGGSSSPFGNLTPEERRRLQRENKEHAEELDYADLGEPGERFTKDSLLSAELSFPASEVERIRSFEGAEDATASLRLKAMRVQGTVPPDGRAPVDPHASSGGFQFETFSVSGVDVAKPDLAMVVPDQIAKGRWFSSDPRAARDEAVVDIGFARQKGLAVGDKTAVGGRELEVVGLASAPLGGDASNVYAELGLLQELSGREGRVNRIQARAESSDAVAGLARRIERDIGGADVVTASDLADRVGGSLDDAESLSSKLGAVLAVVALAAAFLIATLLTLSSVHKRTRELGTLKALGWRQRLVVRQVTGESLVQGAIGGVLGAALGVGGAAIVDAVGLTLQASVEGQEGAGVFGSGNVTAGTAEVVLGAPVPGGLVVAAIGLAMLGGLLAGAAGGLRAARLRPAEALRSAE